MNAQSHTVIHPDKTAWRAVDACGGTYSPEQDASGFSRGHLTALTDALRAVQPVDALMREMLTTGIELAEAAIEFETDVMLGRSNNNRILAAIDGFRAVAKAAAVSTAEQVGTQSPLGDEVNPENPGASQ